MTKKRVDGKKLPLDFDEVTGKTERTHQVKLSTYLEELAQGRVSILHSTWAHVPDTVKKMIWQDVLASFKISNRKQSKRKILKLVGTKWRQFKIELTSDWIFGEYKDISPCEKYNIPQNDWDEFKKIRLDSAWEDELEEQFKNGSLVLRDVCPDILSPEWLESLTKEIKLEVTQDIRKQFGPEWLESLTKKIKLEVTQDIMKQFGPEWLESQAKQIKLMVTQDIMKQFGPVFESLAAKSQLAPVETQVSHVSSSQGSCAATIDPSGKETHSGIYEGIERPKKRVRPLEPINNPILELVNIAPSLYDKPLQVASVFGFENDIPLCIHLNQVTGILHGKTWLSISIIQLWVMFLKALSVDTCNDNVYGFLEPESIQNIGNKKQEAMTYILKHMRDSKKSIYLGAYHKGGDWQLLVLLPKGGVAVWFCSQHRKPNPNIKAIVQGVVTSFNVLEGKHTSKSKQAVCWVYPKCNKQQEGWECGYYVMHWMWIIVRAGIKENWEEAFRDTATLPPVTIEKIRTQWARYFLEVRNSIL